MNLKDIENVCKKFRNEKPFSNRPDIFSAICLASAQAICWGKEGLSLIELGVYNGTGLQFIFNVAKCLTENIGMKYNIYGFDSFEGIPDLKGFEDHNELWKKGQYKCKHTYEKMVKNFKNKATLIKGDVENTITPFLDEILDINFPNGFISLDLDLYTSSRSGLKILEDTNSNKYIPTVTMIVDDQDYLITYNNWCGEGKAIKEFNNENKYRKIQNR